MKTIDHRTYFGVDVGLRRVSIAGVRGDEFAVRTYTVNKDQTLGATLNDLSYATRFGAGEVEDVIGVPTSVIVEQPSGKFIKPSLYYAAGVILSTLTKRYYGVTYDLPPSSWKKAACGKGNASKADHMRVARAFGYDGEIEDEADAICIALAARKLTTVGVADARA